MEYSAFVVKRYGEWCEITFIRGTSIWWNVLSDDLIQFLDGML